MLRKYKRSQSSVEFLSTYGWVMIIILGVLAVMLNYGFLNPSKYLPDRVDFGDQVKCEEYFLDYDVDPAAGLSPMVALNFRNNLLRPINITHLYAKGDSAALNCNIKPVDVGVGEEVIIGCDKLDLSKNVKNKIRFILTFRRNSTEETTPHNISGLLFAGVVEGLYCDGQISVGQYIHCQDNVLSCDEIAIDQGGSHGCPN